LSWKDVTGMFRDENYFDGAADETNFHHLADPTDRKFAALADATGATLVTLVTLDDDFLDTRQQAKAWIDKPEEYLEWLEKQGQ